MSNPPSLKQFQQLMNDNLLSTELDDSSETLMQLFSTQLDDSLRANDNSLIKDEAGLRLAIYRNNVLHSLSSALGDLYPVIKKLIGDDFFKIIAIEFICKQPPAHAALLHYGKGFSQFIKEFEGCKHLKFLPDIAKLEFEYNQAYHSGDADIFEPQQLSTVAPEQLGDIVFSCHPSLKLLKSVWPVDDIWHENQKEIPDIINLDSTEGVNLLIYRLGLSVQLVNLDENCFVFLQQLVNNKTINQAWAETSVQASLFERHLDAEDLSGMLGYLFSLDIFTAFKMNAQ